MPKVANCRFCGGTLNSFMTFGKMPIANAFITHDQIEKEYFFDLTPAYCSSCSLFQLIDQPDPDKLFHENYAFFAGTSVFMQKHFEELANRLITDFDLEEKNLTVEIGNNDGGMVGYLKNLGFKHLGIEPSKNVADAASRKGIEVLNAFFDDKIAMRIREEYGKAKVFLAANTLAHIPDIHSVFRGIVKLLTSDGIVITEDPYLVNLIEKTSYDQIYDEHVYIFSLTAMTNICKEYNLEVFDIEYLSTAGGSLRYYICRKGNYRKTKKVAECERIENTYKFYEDEIYKRFSTKCENSKTDLLKLLCEIKTRGERTAGYGATSKSATIFNYCNIGPDLIDYITDTTPTKIGKLSPGKHIPIYDHKYFLSNMPDYCYLLAWNHKDEIIQKEQYSGRWVTHIPKVQVLR